MKIPRLERSVRATIQNIPERNRNQGQFDVAQADQDEKVWDVC
jgi:hypothetical protein